jgi:hypothetical protein
MLVSDVMCDLKLVIWQSKDISGCWTDEYNQNPELICYAFTAAGWILFGFGVIQFPVWALVAVIKKKEVSAGLHCW